MRLIWKPTDKPFHGTQDGTANNDSVLTSNISGVTNLDLGNNGSGLNIADLTGIEDFAALTSLICDKNQLTSLDLAQNTSLTNLLCTYNQLTSLDVSQNTNLSSLNCHDNQLTSLDVSQNTNLSSLTCFDNYA